MGRIALVTEDITNALTGLVITKNGNYKKVTAEDALKYLQGCKKNPKSKLYGVKLPGIGAIYKELAKIKEVYAQKKETPNILNTPWSIGSCMYYSIPPDVIPLLIKIQAVHGDRKDLLTIRQARWIAKLYPVLRPLLEKEYSEDSKAQISNLLSIVNAYSIREEIAEIHEQQSPDTSDLDEIFFIKGDVTPEATSRAEFDEM